jgi:hypothetical protein
MNDLLTQFDSLFLEVKEDINEYLNSDVPMECYAEDIDAKLESARQEFISLINASIRI